MNEEAPTVFPNYDPPQKPGIPVMHPKESAPVFKLMKFMLKGRKPTMMRTKSHRAPKRRAKFY